MYLESIRPGMPVKKGTTFNQSSVGQALNIVLDSSTILLQHGRTGEMVNDSINQALKGVDLATIEVLAAISVVHRNGALVLL